WNTDLPHGVDGEELRVQLLLVHVGRVEGYAVGFEESQEITLDLEEDRVQVLRRVDPVDQLHELLLVGQPFLEHQKGVLGSQSPLPDGDFWLVQNSKMARVAARAPRY